MPTSTEPANTHDRITTHMPIAEDRQHPSTPCHDPSSRELGRRAEETTYEATPKPIGMIKSHRMTRSCRSDRALEAPGPIGTRKTNEGRGRAARIGSSRGARADSHENELSRGGSVGRSVGRSVRSVGRRRTGSVGGSSRTDEAMGVPRPPPQHGPGGWGWGGADSPPPKELNRFYRNSTNGHWFV